MRKFQMIHPSFPIQVKHDPLIKKSIRNALDRVEKKEKVD
jgi:hypothetical protein